MIINIILIESLPNSGEAENSTWIIYFEISVVETRDAMRISFVMALEIWYAISLWIKNFIYETNRQLVQDLASWHIGFLKRNFNNEAELPCMCIFISEVSLSLAHSLQ